MADHTARELQEIDGQALALAGRLVNLSRDTRSDAFVDELAHALEWGRHGTMRQSRLLIALVQRVQERRDGADPCGLHGLYDCARLTRELGIKRHAAEAIMRKLPEQRIPGLRKSYVRGGDVQRFLDENVAGP